MGSSLRHPLERAEFDKRQALFGNIGIVGVERGLVFLKPAFAARFLERFLQAAVDACETLTPSVFAAATSAESPETLVGFSRCEARIPRLIDAEFTRIFYAR
jgi:hypothetical protein